MNGKASNSLIICWCIFMAASLVLPLHVNAQVGNRGMSCAWPINLRKTIVGTWLVENLGTGTTGQVTFAADGSYAIDSGTYNAGGTFAQASSGTYEILPGEAIAFNYSNTAVVASRIAVIQCASRQSIAHFVMGHTHDFEILTRVK